ncbi:Jerky protein-like protein, partial [Stegodyphus mimosarum]
MQDEAPSHHTQHVFDFLDEYFSDRVIVLNYLTVTWEGIDWAYSPDLTPWDYFLWSTLDSFNAQQAGRGYCQACVEKASAYTEATELFADEFIEIINCQKLSPEQIYNIDEIGLFWQSVLRNTLETSAEKAPTGVKDSKVKVRILACANVCRKAQVCKLFIIGKCA